MQDAADSPPPIPLALQRIEYQLTEADLLAFNLYVLENSATQQRQLRRNRIRVPLVYALLSAFLHLLGSPVAAAIFALVGLAWFILYPRRFRHIFKRHFLKAIRESDDKSLLAPTRLELHADGIWSSNAAGEAKIWYSAITQIERSSTATYLSTSKFNAIILPHGAIAPEQLTAFVGEVQRRMDAQKGATNDADT